MSFRFFLNSSTFLYCSYLFPYYLIHIGSPWFLVQGTLGSSLAWSLHSTASLHSVEDAVFLPRKHDHGLLSLFSTFSPPTALLLCSIPLRLWRLSCQLSPSGTEAPPLVEESGSPWFSLRTAGLFHLYQTYETSYERLLPIQPDRPTFLFGKWKRT